MNNDGENKTKGFQILPEKSLELKQNGIKIAGRDFLRRYLKCDDQSDSSKFILKKAEAFLRELYEPLDPFQALEKKIQACAWKEPQVEILQPPKETEPPLLPFSSSDATTTVEQVNKTQVSDPCHLPVSESDSGPALKMLRNLMLDTGDSLDKEYGERLFNLLRNENSPESEKMQLEQIIVLSAFCPLSPLLKGRSIDDFVSLCCSLSSRALFALRNYHSPLRKKIIRWIIDYVNALLKDKYKFFSREGETLNPKEYEVTEGNGDIIEAELSFLVRDIKTGDIYRKGLARTGERK
jgi:hypothetical protein